MSGYVTPPASSPLTVPVVNTIAHALTTCPRWRHARLGSQARDRGVKDTRNILTQHVVCVYRVFDFVAAVFILVVG